jgi:hypothetical protein
MIKAIRVSGTKFIGNSPELDREFNEMLAGLQRETHKQNPLLSIPEEGEGTENREEPEKLDPGDLDKHPTQKQD